MIITTLLPEEVMTFENRLYAEWDYYENKYGNEDTIRLRLAKEWGDIDICEIMDELREYTSKKTYLNALEAWLGTREYD